MLESYLDRLAVRSVDQEKTRLRIFSTSSHKYHSPNSMSHGLLRNLAEGKHNQIIWMCVDIYVYVYVSYVPGMYGIILQYACCHMKPVSEVDLTPQDPSICVCVCVICSRCVSASSCSMRVAT